MEICVHENELEEFNKIIKQLHINEFKEVRLARKLTSANYKDIFYGTALLNERYCNCDRILLLPYKINQNDVLEAVNSKRKRSEHKNADIDPRRSGNIHPSVSRIAEECKAGELEIKQIILANNCNPSNQAGPACPKCETLSDDETAVYACNELLRTPRANFYPIINEQVNKELTECEIKKQKFLENIFNKLTK